MTRSHGTKLHIMVSKLHSGTSKTKAAALFWKSHCAACSQACVIFHHVAGSSKGSIGVEENSVREKRDYRYPPRSGLGADLGR